jgi:hypothetical protein
VKISGPIAKDYALLEKKVKRVLRDSNIFLHITNLGYLLHSHGIIKNPKQLYSNIESDLIRSIINAKIKEK